MLQSFMKVMKAVAIVAAGLGLVYVIGLDIVIEHDTVQKLAPIYYQTHMKGADE